MNITSFFFQIMQHLLDGCGMYSSGYIANFTGFRTYSSTCAFAITIIVMYCTYINILLLKTQE